MEDKRRNSKQEETEKEERLSKALALAAASTSSGPTTTSRQWAGFKNPRIVRVSRTFGGKDRHSKVCTIRGLRDRRIRLSVPTAIHLYDLQDRLGLNQPSKVIDWLLEAAKLDIDKLPPLQIPAGNFNHQSLFGQFPAGSSFNYLDADLAGPSKEGININDDVEDDVDEDESNSVEDTMNNGTAQSFFPMAGLMGPNYGNMYSNWDPSSSLSLAQFGSHGSSIQQPDQNQMSGAHQLFFCPPFPQHDHNNRFNLLNSNYGSVLRDFVPHHQQMHSGENNAASSQHHDNKGDNS